MLSNRKWKLRSIYYRLNTSILQSPTFAILELNLKKKIKKNPKDRIEIFKMMRIKIAIAHFEKDAQIQKFQERLG